MRLAPAAAALVAGAGALIGVSCPAVAQGERGGDVLVVSADGGDAELERGDASTPFVLRLPTDASCPGDTANDGYRIQTFIVPGADGPAPARFEATKPVGEGSWALYGVDTTPYVQEATEQNDAPGEPGRIGGLRPMNFAVFPEAMLPDGAHRIGIACTLGLASVRYWDTTIVITNGDEESGGLRWRLSSAPVTAPSPGTNPATYVLGGIAVVAGAAAVFLRRSARRGTDPEKHAQREKERVG